MAAQSGGKRNGVRQRVGGWFFRTICRQGWRQWAMLAAAVVVFVLAVLALTGGTDYREDPSALTPRSVDMYMETRDLPALLKNVGAWKVWKEERRTAAGEERNQLQVDIAGLISERVAGMSTSSPMRWLAAATRAAYCLSNAPAEEGGESWALFIEMANPSDALAEIGVERGMTVETLRGTKDGGVFKLTGPAAGELYFGVVAPWLIISSQARLPEFAMDSVRKPAFSLANSGLMPGWKRGTTLRGVYSPASQSVAGEPTPAVIIKGWMASDVRVTYLARVGKSGLETTFGAEFLSDRIRGGGLWPLFSVILFIVAIIAIVAAFAVLLAMVGWGGWLKAKAVKAGVMPASGPVSVEPSEAFQEDSGMIRPAADVVKDTKAAEKFAGVEAQMAENTAKLSDSQNISAADGVNSPSLAKELPPASSFDGYFSEEKIQSRGDDKTSESSSTQENLSQDPNTPST